MIAVIAAAGSGSMFKRIDHVEIVTPDMDQTIDFYTNVLGFKLRERHKTEAPPLEEIAYLDLADTTIELMAVKSAVPLPAEPWTAGYRMMAIEVDDMDATVAYLKTKGVELSRGPVQMGKSKRAEIKDPNGVSLEIRQW